MPLREKDKRFLGSVDRMKLYLLLMGIAVLVYIQRIPSDELQMATSIIGLALCGLFWITQRLLSMISVLDFELTRLTNAVKHSLTTEQRKELFSD